MKQKLCLIVMMISCLFVMMPGVMQAEEESTAVITSNEPVEFPVAFKRATGDKAETVVADEKGTLVVLTSQFLNITHDYGKNWVSHKLPGDEGYSLHYVKGKYYLATYHVQNQSSVIRSYVSSNGDQWMPFTLKAANGISTTIQNVQYLNGKYILTAKQNDTGAIIFTSTDGVTWSEIGAIPADIDFLTWNGSTYTAFGSGYIFFGKPKTLNRNQFFVQARDKRYAEMIIYTSTHLSDWTMQSGAVKSDLRYQFRVNGVPRTNYGLVVEPLESSGIITLFDVYGNKLTSKDGITFTMTRYPGMITADSARDRSPMFKVGNSYIVFTRYWYSSGVIRSRAVISTDKVKWKKIDLDKSVPNDMNVIQAGKKLVGYGYDKKVAISDNGIDWTIIR